METSLGGIGRLSRGPGSWCGSIVLVVVLGVQRESSSRATEQLSLTRLNCKDLGPWDKAKVQVCMPCA